MANPRCSARFLRFLLAPAIVVFQVSPAFCQGIDPRGQAPHPLARLTPPSDVLPRGCQPRQTGPFGSNPAVTTDPTALGLIYLMVIGTMQADGKSWQPSQNNATGTESAQALGERMMAEAVARADAGYAGFFREEGGSPEIGVYALRLKKPLTDSEAQSFRAWQAALAPNQIRILKGSVLVFAWADGQLGAPGCWDVVRRHLEQVDVK